MTILLIVIVIYLCTGLIALGLLDLATHRIRTKLWSASAETQETLWYSGNLVGRRTALIITVIALWICWPVALYSWVASKITKTDKGGVTANEK